PGRLIAQRLLPWVWVVAVPALYLARGVPVISRYLLPLEPVLAWLAWRAAERWWIGDEARPASATRVAVLRALVAAVLLVQNGIVYRTSVLPHVRSFSAGLERSLVKWGRWFGAHTPSTVTIATPDIGAIAYYSDRRVLDLAGLVTPEIVPLLERATPAQAIADLESPRRSQPDFVVDRADPADDLRRRSRYAECLTPIGTASIDGLGIARPGLAIYTFYRVDWIAYAAIAARSGGTHSP